MNTDPFSLVRVFNRMRQAGFSLSVDGEDLVVKPAQTLTDTQRAYLRAHKGALVALLTDAETLAGLLDAAQAEGISEGLPLDWEPMRRLAALEILFSSRRVVYQLGRYYGAALAPPMPTYPDAVNVPEIAASTAKAAVTIDVEAYEERAAIMEYDGGLPRDEAEAKAMAIAVRTAELQANGWSPWNAG